MSIRRKAGPQNVTSRFERVSGADVGAGGGKICSPFELLDSLPPHCGLPGGYLAHLWALFGAPDESDGGFTYGIRDRTTALEFTAYSGPSGPAFGGSPLDRERLTPVLRDFARTLTATRPVDCEIITDRDDDYGGGALHIGFVGGRVIHRGSPPKPPRAPRRKK